MKNSGMSNDISDLENEIEDLKSQLEKRKTADLRNVGRNDKADL